MTAKLVNIYFCKFVLISLEGVFKISVQMVFLNFSTTKRHIYMPIFLLKTDIHMQILSTETNLTEYREFK